VETIVHTTEIVSVVVFMLLQQLDARQSAHMASLMWSIWKHRNLKLWQNVSTTSTQVVDHVTQLIEDWEHANLVRQRQQSRDSPSGNNNVSYNRNDGSGSRNNDQGSNTIVAPASRSNQAHPTWVKLTTERYNGNIDASFSSQRNRVGIGMSIRDDEGRFLLAKTMWMSPICNVDIGEALELFHTLNWVWELQLGSVDFALDLKMVVDYFHKGGE
jgi:hypothetical protein